MAWQSTPEFIPLLVSAMVCAALGAFAWRHRRVPAAGGFVLLMASSAWWSLAYAFYRANASFQGKALLAVLTQAGAIVVAVAWAVFALQFTGRDAWLRRWWMALSAIPALTLVMVATNPVHHAFWTRFALVERGGRAAIDSVPAWGFWLHVVYSWGLMWLAVGVVGLRALRSAHLYRRQAWAIVVAAAVPWIGNVLHVAGWVRFPANPMPVLFTLSGAVFFWAIFRLRLLDLVPVARAALVEEMPDGVVVLDEAGRVLDVNPAARRILALGEADLVGRPAAEVLGALGGAMDQEAAAGPVRVEVGTGEGAHPVDVRVTTLHDARGRVNGRLLVLRDVGETERREGALALQRAFLEQLFDAAPEGLALLDESERVLDVNPEWSRLFGYPADEARGRRINDLIVPDHLRGEGAAITAQVASGARTEAETVRRRKDGGVTDVHITGAPVFARGQRVGTWGIYHDISERKAQERARAALLEREREARAAAEAATRRAAFLADVGTLLSAAFVRRAGYQELARLAVAELADYCLIDEVTPEGGTRRVALAHREPGGEALLVPDAVNPPDGDPERRPVLQVVRTGAPLLVPEVTDDVISRLGHDDRTRAAFTRIQPRSFIIVPLIARGRTLGAITLAYDHSGRRYGPEDLTVAQEMARRAALAIDNARLYAEAQEAVRARDSVLGVVSHDLRNPLAAILLHADFLLADPGLPPDARESAEQVVRGAEAMERMIRDLLDVARIEAGQLRVEAAPLSACGLLDQAAAMMMPLARERGTALEQVPAAECPDVAADFDRVMQVFSNLVGNALKFTPAGGTVMLGADPGPREVRFWVRDTGPGIAPDHVERLWESFWQADGPARRAGAGLGLPIVRGIVEAHGGAVGVETVPGVGATFWFTLPVA
jgi:PAS domain S-box-containing protein